MTEFSVAICLTHFFNFVFLSLLVRSGVEILGGHPKLYWNDHCAPGSEWTRFPGRPLPSNAPWTAEDEITPLSPWIALPGHNNLGLGRHWHFAAVVGWIACGVTYLTTLFVSPDWRRLVPTSLSIVPAAWRALVTYARFHIPQSGGAFNPLQQLIYFLVIFGVAPLTILTGLAMSPALTARFPRVARAFGGHQVARSVHFLCLIAFVLFFVVHVAMVVVHGFGAEMARIVLGGDNHSHGLATVIGLSGIAVVVVLHVGATQASLRHPAATKEFLEIGIGPLGRLLFHHWNSGQHQGTPSAYARVNGRPPRNPDYAKSVAIAFADWRLRIDGLVDQPLTLTLDELRAMPRSTQSTLHICIQGWSYVAVWAGVPIAALLARARPQANARYLVFHTCDEKWERPGHGYYYEVIDLETARRPQVLLAYDMNGEPLGVAHGAPLRLRIEHQLGYKMAKWVNRIELIEDFRAVGGGQGGWREDVLRYSPTDAGI